MKKTLLPGLPGDLPRELRALADGAKIYDSSCSPEARVYFIDRGGGYYLKCAARGTLEKEARMAGYFHAKALGPEVLQYLSVEDGDWLLTAALDGEDCLHPKYLDEPGRGPTTAPTFPTASAMPRQRRPTPSWRRARTPSRAGSSSTGTTACPTSF